MQTSNGSDRKVASQHYLAVPTWSDLELAELWGFCKIWSTTKKTNEEKYLKKTVLVLARLDSILLKVMSKFHRLQPCWKIQSAFDNAWAAVVDSAAGCRWLDKTTGLQRLAVECHSNLPFINIHQWTSKNLGAHTPSYTRVQHLKSTIPTTLTVTFQWKDKSLG